MGNAYPLDQNVELAGPSRPKSPSVENSLLESIRSSLKEEITSENKTLLLESQKKTLKLLRPETGENTRDHVSEELENETRSFYTPTKTVRINSTQNEDPNVICNNSQNILNCSKNKAESGIFDSSHKYPVPDDCVVYFASYVVDNCISFIEDMHGVRRVKVWGLLSFLRLVV